MFRVVLRTPKMNRYVAVVSVYAFELKCREFRSPKVSAESGEDQTAIAKPRRLSGQAATNSLTAEASSGARPCGAKPRLRRMQGNAFPLFHSLRFRVIL